MELHRNAKLSVKGRELLVDRVETAGGSKVRRVDCRSEREPPAVRRGRGRCSWVAGGMGWGISRRRAGG